MITIRFINFEKKTLQKYFVSFLVFLFCNQLIANEIDTATITRYRPGFMWFYTGLKPAEVEKVRKYDRLIIDFTHNDFISPKKQIAHTKIPSLGFNANFLFEQPLTKGNTFSFAVGLAYGLNHYNLKDFFFRNGLMKSTEVIPNAKLYGFKRSILNIHSIGIPFELRLRGKNWKHFKAHVGGKLSYNYSSNTILITKNDKFSEAHKVSGFHDLNRFSASTHLRFGIRNWSFFASYAFVPIFKSKDSPKLHPLQLGISLSLF